MSGNGKSVNSRRNNPRRGFPGVLCFCETGKENKCEREAKDILNYYYTQSHGNRIDQSGGSNLSLEEEIAMLSKGDMADTASFLKIYDTGCKGIVFLMSTLQNSELVNVVRSRAPIPGENKRNLTREIDEVNDYISVRESKRIRIENSEDKLKTKWDPVETVSNIFQGIKERDVHSPSSRFITRMVPIQVTCFASMDEIVSNVRELLSNYLIPKGISELECKDGEKKTLPTFRISFKRRLCDHIKTSDVIDSVARVMDDLTSAYFTEPNVIKKGITNQQLFGVDLSNPDYTIIIEICRTLVGMSVVKNAHNFNNFNLNVTKEKLR